jgi:hypothetical protein
VTVSQVPNPCCNPKAAVSGVSRAARFWSSLDLDLVDVECDEDRLGERFSAGSSWAHPSACGKDESSEVPVVVAVVGGARPLTDWLGNVVVPADEAGSIHVQSLSS